VSDTRSTDVEALEQTLTASRALLGVVARSVADALDQVTLPQFRVLVVLSAEGPLRVSTLAQRMRAVPSTFSRALDRMEAAGLLAREENPESRREVLVTLTDAGRRLVADVTERRRAEIRAILQRLTPAEQHAVAGALASFARAAGEPSAEDLLVLGL
jgi:DNA-binding MarR family transcriptional regulator